ncbi:carbon-nitrogen hydrolase family protein [Algoriphagus sp. SE2]|uniref:carbon-nitrogen hydrolase family protein n=1 Tax=Algoriphagus sp. SE2 TaxID=3141536 RepID=UPI0031CD1126
MKLKVCLIQDNPIFFDKEKTFEKIEMLSAQYAKEGNKLIVFPESFIPGYPRGFTFGAKIGSRTTKGREQYANYHANSFDLESSDLERLETLCIELEIYLVIGVTEKSSTNGSLYCSMLYFSPNGFLGVHRKIKPTGTERLIWAEDSGKSLVSFDTKIGKLGGLICWENYMPLARMAMYQKGVEIYIAPTADARENWISTMRHIALEGRCFVLGCNQFFTKSMYADEFQKELKEEQEIICNGGSVIVSPLGEVLAGPLFGESGAVSAEIDLNLIIKSKLDFDPIGHYSRNDIFELIIKDQPPMKKEKP